MRQRLLCFSRGTNRQRCLALVALFLCPVGQSHGSFAVLGRHMGPRRTGTSGSFARLNFHRLTPHAGHGAVDERVAWYVRHGRDSCPSTGLKLGCVLEGPPWAER